MHNSRRADPLFLPQLNKLHEPSIVRGEDVSNVADIPTQNRLTHQILSMCQHFDNALLNTRAKLFRTARDRKGLF